MVVGVGAVAPMGMKGEFHSFLFDCLCCFVWSQELVVSLHSKNGNNWVSFFSPWRVNRHGSTFALSEARLCAFLLTVFVSVPVIYRAAIPDLHDSCYIPGKSMKIKQL